MTNNDKPFVSKFQPYSAYVALCFFSIIIVFSGWNVFTHNKDGSSNWAIEDFVTS